MRKAFSPKADEIYQLLLVISLLEPLHETNISITELKRIAKRNYWTQANIQTVNEAFDMLVKYELDNKYQLPLKRKVKGSIK